MNHLSDYLVAMRYKAHDEGRDDLNWYFKPSVKEQLLNELMAFHNEGFISRQTVLEAIPTEQYLGIEVNLIFTQAQDRRHRYLVILGEVESEWALGLTATGLIEEVQYAY